MVSIRFQPWLVSRHGLGDKAKQEPGLFSSFRKDSSDSKGSKKPSVEVKKERLESMKTAASMFTNGAVDIKLSPHQPTSSSQANKIMSRSFICVEHKGRMEIQESS